MGVGIHGLYWVVPLLTGLVWLTNLVGLLGYWKADDLREYERNEASVVFISDVGAAHHPFFIGLCCTTAGLYMLTVLIERHLRHQRRIPGSLHKRTTQYDIVSVVFAIIGALGLIFLSIFDAFRYSTAHWSCTLVFIVFVALSVIFQVLEVYSLAKRHPEAKGLLYTAAVIKTLIVSVAIAVAIAFIVLYGICQGDAPDGDARCDRIVSAAAVCEWVVSFLLFFYFITYILDMLPAAKNAKDGLSEDGEMVEDAERAAQAGIVDPSAAYSQQQMSGRMSQNSTLNGGTLNASPKFKTGQAL